MEPRIFLAVPSYGGIDQDVIVNGLSQPSGKFLVNLRFGRGSALANVFNRLWVQALTDPQITHFAMLHADVCPQPGWIDVLMGVMEREQADLVSAVIPIKHKSGATSTAIAERGESWRFKKRFTMREVMQLPPTFDAARADFPGDVLLINTGCWLANLRSPRWREVDADGCLKMFFTLRDRVRLAGDDAHVEMEPEDWFFSRRAHEAGLKVLATREVSVIHQGLGGFPNQGAWGDETDHQLT